MEVLKEDIKKENDCFARNTKNEIQPKDSVNRDKFDDSDDSEGELQIDECPMPVRESVAYEEINHSRDEKCNFLLSNERYQQGLLNPMKVVSLNKIFTARNNRRSSYTDLDLHEAIASVINGKLRPVQAVSLYGIPRRTLFRRLGIVRNILGIKTNKNHRLKSSKIFKEDPKRR